MIINPHDKPNIYLPKYQDVEMELPVVKAGLAGQFTLRTFKYDANGNEVTTKEIGPFPNLITNNGLDEFGTKQLGNSCMAYCQVGTGTSTPSVGDTALATYVASVVAFSGTTGSDLVGRRYVSVVKTYRFGQGAAAGNISEVGAASTTGSGNLFSRALVVDGGGTPTTISVSTTEWLDVTYECRNYAYGADANGDPDDQTGTIDISGTTYNYTLRAGNLADLNTFRANNCIGDAFKNYGLSSMGFYYSEDAVLGSVNGLPTGYTQYGALNTTTGTGFSNGTYTPGTYSKSGTLTMGLTAANATADGGSTYGVRILVPNTGNQAFQIRLGSAVGDNPVPKDNTKVWTYLSTMTWTRTTI